MKWKCILSSTLFFLLVSCHGKSENKQNVAKPSLPKEAVVLTEGLKVRLSPNRVAAELGRLEEGMKVEILSHSPEKEKIGQYEAYWYKIKTDDDLIGWVYGAYLNIDNQNQKLQNEDELKTKFLKDLQGKWFTVRRGGGYGSFFISFFPDLEYEAGYGTAVSYRGQFVIEPKTSSKFFVTLIPKHKKNKPPIEEIIGKKVGLTLSLKAKLGKREVRLEITDKYPKKSR
ncbi:MAG: SH3 domain-containing protein [Candidatus Hydrogenedentota bacterium]|nr:MAG: SH3 domain-containing protein [Candidatus Hydrogenedentota bacterium]